MSRSAALLVSLALAAAAAGPAWAGSSPRDPGSSSAVPQYVEQVPTSGGSKTPGVGTSQTKTLPSKLKKSIARNGGSDASALETLASSSDYGAPSTTTSRRTAAVRPSASSPKASSAGKPKAATTPATGQSAAGASLAPVSSNGGTSELIWLAALLSALAIAAGVIFGLRRFGR